MPELCRRCSGARRVGEGGQPSARPPLPVPLCVFPSALLCNGAAPGSGTHCHREPGAFWGCSVRTMGAKVPRRGLRAPRFLPRLWNAFAVCPAFSSSLCSAGLQTPGSSLPPAPCLTVGSTLPLSCSNNDFFTLFFLVVLSLFPLCAGAAIGSRDNGRRGLSRPAPPVRTCLRTSKRGEMPQRRAVCILNADAVRIGASVAVVYR